VESLNFVKFNAKYLHMVDTKQFYVYAYIREQDSRNIRKFPNLVVGTFYYIGKGCGHRAYKSHGRIPVPKNKENIIILFENLSEYESFQCECFLIRFYGRVNFGNGILRNLTNGGEGISGFVMDEASKIARSTKLKGKIVSQKTRSRLATAIKGKTYGPQTAEHKKKVGDHFSQTVWVTNTETKKTKRIPMNTVEHFEKDGWIIGRPYFTNKSRTGQKSSSSAKEKMSKSIKNLRWINDGHQQKRIVQNKTDNYLENGWIFGKLK
jgi:hypothetical protein